jgi:bifunctional non-homologous end joining protein LigD
VFDCLYKDGLDLRREPLTIRRAVLDKLLGKTSGTRDRIFASIFLASNGLRAFEVAKKKSYEGLVAKDISAPYVSGRSNKWLKVKVHQEDEFLIVGYTEPAGTRKHFGALLLGAYDRGKLRYVGKVGTGFDQKSLARLYRMFQPLLRVKAAVIDPPRESDVTYLAPRLVAEIAYEELTTDRKLRQPVFLGLRDDKRPQDVKLPEAK